jgi:hypothetical protein
LLGSPSISGPPLTEQKVSKLILLIEELRHDLPMVKDRNDPQATAMQEAADTAQVAELLKRWVSRRRATKWSLKKRAKTGQKLLSKDILYKYAASRDTLAADLTMRSGRQPARTNERRREGVNWSVDRRKHGGVSWPFALWHPKATAFISKYGCHDATSQMRCGEIRRSCAASAFGRSSRPGSDPAHPRLPARTCHPHSSTANTSAWTPQY